MRPSCLLLLPLAGIIAMSGGCSLLRKPDKANIELRKQNQELQARLAESQRTSEADAARLRSIEGRAEPLPTLPRERLAKLFTAHDIKLGRLTGGADLDPAKPGQEGLKIHVTPLDETGDPIKAAGAFTVEAFDLSQDQGVKIGTWTIDAAAARENWSSVLNRYEYVFSLPWQMPPMTTSLHLDVTFDDELTQRRFKKSADVTVDSPPGAEPANAATGPAAAPATLPASAN